MKKINTLSAAVIAKWIRAHIGKIHLDSYKLFKQQTSWLLQLYIFLSAPVSLRNIAYSQVIELQNFGNIRNPKDSEAHFTKE